MMTMKDGKPTLLVPVVMLRLMAMMQLQPIT